MSRWRKGTLDHDGDGKMGGSNPKESSMTAKKKTDETKPTAFDGEEGLRARNATMETDAVKADGQTSTASKAKGG